MKKKMVNYELQKKIRSYITYMHDEEKKGYYRGALLINSISMNLKNEMAIDGYGRFLKEISFMKENFSEDFINHLCFKMKEMTLVPNEILVFISYLKLFNNNYNLYLFDY